MSRQPENAPLFVRNKAGLKLTPQGEIVVNYARRMKALHERMFAELQNAERHLSLLRIGITHTSESNLTAAALARYSNQKGKLKIILFTDTINNLYDMLENYELDLAIVDGAYGDPRFSSMLLDTDYLTCVMSVDNPLARKGAVTLAELRRQKMILRTPPRRRGRCSSRRSRATARAYSPLTLRSKSIISPRSRI